MLSKDVLLRTRRGLLYRWFEVYGDSALLVLNGSLLNSINALLVLNRSLLNGINALLALSQRHILIEIKICSHVRFPSLRQVKSYRSMEKMFPHRLQQILYEEKHIQRPNAPFKVRLKEVRNMSCQNEARPTLLEKKDLWLSHRWNL